MKIKKLILIGATSLSIFGINHVYSQMNPKHKDHGLFWKITHRRPDCPECEAKYTPVTPVPPMNQSQSNSTNSNSNASANTNANSNVNSNSNSNTITIVRTKTKIRTKVNTITITRGGDANVSVDANAKTNVNVNSNSNSNSNANSNANIDTHMNPNVVSHSNENTHSNMSEPSEQANNSVRPRIEMKRLEPRPISKINTEMDSELAKTPVLKTIPVPALPTSTVSQNCADCDQQEQNNDIINLTQNVSTVLEDACLKKILEINIEVTRNVLKQLGCKADNPCSVKAILDKVAEYMKVPSDLLYATTWQESKWKHLDPTGNTLSNVSHEYGLMQISDWWHDSKAKTDSEFLNNEQWNEVLEDPLTNAIKGGDILRWSLKYARNYNIKHKKNWNEQQVYQAAYAVYNGGPKSISRWNAPGARYHSNDVQFLSGLKTKPWADSIKDCDKKTTTEIKPITIKPVPVVVVAAEPSPKTIPVTKTEPPKVTQNFDQDYAKPNKGKEADACLAKLNAADLEKIKNMVRELGCKTDSPCAVKVILDFAAKKYNLPTSLIYAIAQTESKWAYKDNLFKTAHGQWYRNGTPLKNENKCVNENGKKYVCSTDWGLMQINDKSHGSTTDIAQIKEDVFYNILYGARIINDNLNRVKAYNKLNDMNWSSEEIYRATYSAYNAGPKNLTRFQDIKDSRDSNFYDNFSHKTWTKGIKDCI